MKQARMNLTPRGISPEKFGLIISNAFAVPSHAAKYEAQLCTAIMAITPCNKKSTRPQWKHKPDAAKDRHKAIIKLCKTWFKSGEIATLTGENIHTTMRDLRDLADHGHLERRIDKVGRKIFNAYRAT